MKLNKSFLRLAYSAPLVLAILLSYSCSSELISEKGTGILPENTYPLEFSVALDGHQQSRAGGKDTWNAGDKVGVKLYDKTSVYRISADAVSLEPDVTGEKLYWENMDKSLVKSWFPAEKVVKNISNQSAGYSDFDFLYAEKEMDYTSTGADATLTFKHQMSKVECTVNSDASLTVNAVKFFGATEVTYDAGIVSPAPGLGEITPEKSSDTPAKYTAVLCPMQMQNEYFILVETNKGDFVYKSSSETETNLKAGYLHKFNITVVEGDVKFSASGVTGWTEDVTESNAAAKKFTVTLPNVRPGSLVITDLNTSAQVTPSGEFFQTTTTGFSIEYTPSSDEESKTFIIDGGGIGNVNRTWVKTGDTPTYKYTFRFTGIKSDITLSYGEYLQVGDYYFNDNTCSVVPTNAGGATCIGIVFHVGTGNGDDKANYPEPILTNGIRGYVVALNDADNNGCQWSSENVDATSNDKQLWNGYVNTKAIETKLASYPAFKACVEYATSASQDCSGWYLPSKAQLEEVYIQGSILKELINKSGLDASWLDEASWYWNSTQYDSEKAEMLQNGGGTAWTKQFEAKVRPVLTF